MDETPHGYRTVLTYTTPREKIHVRDRIYICTLITISNTIITIFYLLGDNLCGQVSNKILTTNCRYSPTKHWQDNKGLSTVHHGVHRENKLDILAGALFPEGLNLYPKHHPYQSAEYLRLSQITNTVLWQTARKHSCSVVSDFVGCPLSLPLFHTWTVNDLKPGHYLSGCPFRDNMSCYSESKTLKVNHCRQTKA